MHAYSRAPGNVIGITFRCLVYVSTLASSAGLAQPSPGPAGPGGRAGAANAADPAATEIWEPVPPVVEPRVSPFPGQPPDDAIMLFDGDDLAEWVNVSDGSPAGWIVADGVLTVNKAAGNIETMRRFGSFELHLEWRVPENIAGSGQSRGNSGIFLASTGRGDAGYELQVLDSFGNATYVNGMAGSIYKQSIPLANPARPPGEWQAYDIEWTAPEFAADGALVAPARVTAWFNGVLVQDDFALRGETVFIGEPRYRAHGDSPIKLQAHGDPSPPISFRNIWVRPRP